MKPIDKTAKMCIIALSTEHGARSTEHGARSTEHGARSTDRVTIPFSPHAFRTEYTKRNDNAGAVCPAGSLRFFA